MSDKKPDYPGRNNIRGLVQDLAEQFDAIADALREETVFAGTRPKDAKTFMLISRQARGISDLAKALQISRQATHKSVQRLIAAGVVELNYVEGSRRDMIASITPAGLEARKVGLHIAGKVEAQAEARIGKARLEAFRQTLQDLTRRED